MAKLKTHPVFYTTLTLLFLAAAGIATLLVALRNINATSKEQIQQREELLKGFARKNPFPSQENAKLVEDDLERITQLLATYQQELRGRGTTADKILNTVPPSTSTEAYFEFAQFILAMRTAAQTAGVSVPNDFRFGFASYSTNGPEPEVIPAVYRQRLIAEHLLTTLFAINTPEQPIELAGFSRERPTAAAAAGARPAPAQQGGAQSGGGEGGDFFDMDMRISARVPNFVEANAFRLTLVGYTHALRAFLNQLATFEVPIVVRSVEIVPAAGADRSGGGPPPPPQRRPQARPQGFGDLFAPTADEKAKENEPQPLVQPARSRFTITVEFINLVGVETPATAGAAPSAQPQPNA